jgi:hypothetical protein
VHGLALVLQGHDRRLSYKPFNQVYMPVRLQEGMSLEVPRRAQRRSVVLPARRRAPSHSRDEGEISDVSAQGCCVKINAGLLRVGSHVSVQPDDMDAVGATVRWVAGFYAGLEFDQPLCDTMRDQLTQMQPMGAYVKIVRD